MLPHIPFLLLSINGVLATPLQYFKGRGSVDNTSPYGINPVTHFTTEYLGLQTANNSCSHRDLGFTGQLGGKWYAIYGDTLWCAAGVTNPNGDNTGTFNGMVRDSISECTDSALSVQDLHLNSGQRQEQFIPYNTSWGETNTYGFGGTSLVETDDNTSTPHATGAVFYLVNTGSGETDALVGAGVAQVKVVNGTPTATQRMGVEGWWWNTKTTPRYGDQAAYRDVNSDYIYAYGGPPSSETGLSSLYMYQARVKAREAFNLSSYEYWWGREQGWSSEPLTTFSSETAVMWGAGQGQVVYNEFYKQYIYVHLDLGGNVVLRTAPSPEGPWTSDVQVYAAPAPLVTGGLVYAGVAHPYLDSTGRNLTISFTNSNHIEVIKVNFL